METKMNSQIFPNNEMMKSSQSEAAGLLQWQTHAVQWISISLLIAIVILFPERPAWGSDVRIEADSAGIMGVANGAGLGDVLEVLADKTGYTIYMDIEAVDTKVSFNIPNHVSAERAIQIILHPLSHALVYAKTSDPLKIRIDQIQVYYAYPAEPASESTTTPATDSAFGKNPSDETKMLALAIAYGNE